MRLFLPGPNILFTFFARPHCDSPEEYLQTLGPARPNSLDYTNRRRVLGAKPTSYPHQPSPPWNATAATTRSTGCHRPTRRRMLTPGRSPLAPTRSRLRRRILRDTLRTSGRAPTRRRERPPLNTVCILLPLGQDHSPNTFNVRINPIQRAVAGPAGACRRQIVRFNLNPERDGAAEALYEQARLTPPQILPSRPRARPTLTARRIPRTVRLATWARAISTGRACTRRQGLIGLPTGSMVPLR